MRLVVATALVLAAATPTAGAHPAPATSRSQELARLTTTHALFATLTRHHVQAGEVQASRPITGGQTVLPVVGHGTGQNGTRWLKVLVPGRPNGRSRWISERGTVADATPWRVVVRPGSRQVQAFRGGRLVRTFTAIVGKPSTPTPRGRFFVEESVRMLPGSVGAPFALALSARSNVLQEFAGGPGQIALHGIGNVGGTLGTAASHGCVRFGDAAIRWLAYHIPPGAPVTITG